ncbi:MAG TPA: hypothetical protein VFW19_03860, partial [Allosphingosinicella sp.]|nr:hypothetical protein [Allosphingosinicella sp.]
MNGYRATRRSRAPPTPAERRAPPVHARIIEPAASFSTPLYLVDAPLVCGPDDGPAEYSSPPPVVDRAGPSARAPHAGADGAPIPDAAHPRQAPAVPDPQRPPPPAQGADASRPPAPDAPAGGDRGRQDGRPAAGAAAPHGGPSHPPAHAAAPAVHPAPGAHAHQARGGHRPSAAEQREAQAERAASLDAARARIARPPLEPRADSPDLARNPVYIAVNSGRFAAPTSLDVAPRAPDGRRDSQRPAAGDPSPEMARSAYAAAAAESLSFYRRLDQAARAVAADAMRQNRDLADRHRASLDRALAHLAAGTGTARAHNENLRLSARGLVQAECDRLRAEVMAAAAAGLRRLIGMNARYHNEMGGPRRASREAIGRLDSAFSGVNANASYALDALMGLSRDPTPALATGQDAVAEAIREAQRENIQPRIETAKTNVSDRAEAIRGFLQPLKNCLPCEFDGAFQQLDARVQSVAVAGPHAVRAARDGALRSIADTQEQLELSIDDTHRQMDDQLVQQHDRAREGMIRQARAIGAAERSEIEQTGARQSDILGAMAGAQPTALDHVHEDFAKSVGLAPGEFNRKVMRDTLQMRANIAGIAARNPQAVERGAATVAAGRVARVDAMDGDREASVRQLLDGLDAQTRAGADQVRANCTRSIGEMRNLPQQVRTACDGFLGPSEAVHRQEVERMTEAVSRSVAKVGDAIEGRNAQSAPAADHSGGDAPARRADDPAD